MWRVTCTVITASFVVGIVFSSSEKAECALDCPLFFHGLVANNNRLPGQVYSASQQCNYQFPNYTYCSRTPYGRSVGISVISFFLYENLTIVEVIGGIVAIALH